MPSKRGSSAVWLSGKVLAVVDKRRGEESSDSPRQISRVRWIEDLIWAYEKGAIVRREELPLAGVVTHVERASDDDVLLADKKAHHKHPHSK